MNTTITDFIDVRAKLSELGYRSPSGLALLPANVESATTAEEIRQRSESATVRTLFRQAGIPFEDVYNPSSRPPYIRNHDITWFAPTIFVAASVISANPNLVSVALGVLSNYLTDFFKGRLGETKIKMSFVVEQTKSEGIKGVSVSWHSVKRSLHENQVARDLTRHG